MNSKRFFFVMIGAVAFLTIIFGALAYNSSKILQAEGNKLLELKLADSVLNKQEKGLEQAKRDIKEYSNLENITKSIVPENKDQASTIAEISTMANEAGINLGSIEFPESELGQVAQKKGAKQVDNSKTQLTELPDLKGVYVMEIKISSHNQLPVSYDQIIKYLDMLESSRRTAQVTDIDILPDVENPSKFSFTITLNTYVRPE